MPTRPTKAAAKKPAAKKATKAAAPEAPPVTAPEPAAPKAPTYKLKDLVTAVATSTGSKKPDAKEIVEATLAALAAALQSGADLALPPLGRARVVKSESRNGTPVMTLKLRLGGADKPGAKQTLAVDGEDS
jgi:nucleoid DNA-binding protein